MSEPTRAGGPPPEDADVAIVGAGMAGLYCAWRLLEKDPSLRVVVLEKLDRTGGRLQTDHVILRDQDGNPVEVKDEEGGMRFNFSMQQLITLLAELDLCSQIVPFGMGDDNNRYFARGRGFTVGASAANSDQLWGELYNLKERERFKSPTDLVTEIYHVILAQNGITVPPANPTPEFWQRFRLDFSFDGVPMNRWGLWALLRTYGYSEEAITMMAHTLGFAAPFLDAEVNAGEAMQILEDFPANPSYYSLDQGYETLPTTLKHRIEKRGGQILLATTVHEIEPDTDGGFVVAAGPTHGLGSGEPFRLGCKKLILALPRLALTRLFERSPRLAAAAPRTLDRNLESVQEMRLCKVNFYYDEAWWHDGTSRQPPISDGPSFTDLPAGSAYVFDPIRGESRNGPAALTIYCDFTNTNFWQEIQAIGPRFTSPLQKEHDERGLLVAASERLVAEATRQLRKVFATAAVPRPQMTSFRLWDGEGLFGYAYHQWRRDVDDREVMAALTSPIENLYTCNEAYSDQQGWVNGSLRSADLALQKLGLPPLVPDPAHWTSPCPPPTTTTRTRRTS